MVGNGEEVSVCVGSLGGSAREEIAQAQQLTSTWYGIDSKKMDVAETLLLVVMKP